MTTPSRIISGERRWQDIFNFMVVNHPVVKTHTMPVRYVRRLEFFDAVQFVRIRKEGNVPEFNYLPDWVKFALDNKIISIDGENLLWGYRELDRRIKPGNWIMRSMKTGTLKFKSDTDFQDQFEQHEEH